MIKNFLKCGITGWCLEILWTSLNSLIHGEYKLMGQSSIWMFPIYGMAALIRPLSRLFQGKSLLTRGLIYMNGIFSMEYLTGIFLKRKGICPWDYSDAKMNYRGVIRLDYAPVWFFTGLLYERILKKS